MIKKKLSEMSRYDLIDEYNGYHVEKHGVKADIRDLTWNFLKESLLDCRAWGEMRKELSVMTRQELIAEHDAYHIKQSGEKEDTRSFSTDCLRHNLQAFRTWGGVIPPDPWGDDENDNAHAEKTVDGDKGKAVPKKKKANAPSMG